MNPRQLFNKTLVTIVAALASVSFSGVATAQGVASSKAAFAYSELVSLPSCSSTSGGCGSISDNSGWSPIRKQQIKLPNQKDLFMGASLQCGIVTDTTVKSLNGSEDSAEARGTIRVRIKITTPTGSVVYAEPNSGRNATGAADGDGVVFCDRIQSLKARFSGLNCTANLTTGVVTCATPEELQLILKTLNANAFNFVAPNLSSGVHTVEVQARSSAATGATGANGSLASANAFIGAGSVAVESVRMIRGNDGTTLAID